jgi:hypothetical protein
MGSGAMIYTPNFIKIGSAIQKLIGVHSQVKDSMVIVKSYVYSFQNKESMLKNWYM